MEVLEITDLAGRPTPVEPDAVETLRGSLDGSSVAPGEAGYDQARQIWNAMIDRRPALIAKCLGAEDVQRCVRFARRHRMPLTVRGGGHNIGGRAVADGALMIDLSERREVRVDVEAGVADVGPGATLGDLDAAAQAHGRVVPTGIVSETGIAGLTLGGGFGWLSRRWGLTCDHLLEAEAVTGEGEIVTAGDAGEGSVQDLLWALRGGGGGGVIVTSFRFRLRPLAGPVTAGMMIDEARGEALARFRDRTADGPDDLTCLLRLGAAPPAPFLPESLHGRPVAVTAVCHSGPAERALLDLAPLRAGASPAADLITARPFTQFQAMFDAGEPRGRRNYWKSEYIVELDDELGRILLEAGGRLPSPAANIKIFQLGGAVARVPAGATSAAHRDARFIVVVASAWEKPAGDEANVSWVRETWRQVHARSGRGGYVNFLTADSAAEEWGAAQSGVDFERLARVRQRFDPDGLFR